MPMPNPEDWRRIRKGMQDKRQQDNDAENDLVFPDGTQLSTEELPFQLGEEPEDAVIVNNNTSPQVQEEHFNNSQPLQFPQARQKQFSQQSSDNVSPPRMSIIVENNENGQELAPKFDNMALTPEQAQRMIDGFLALNRMSILQKKVDIAASIVGIILGILGIAGAGLAISSGVKSVTDPNRHLE